MAKEKGTRPHLRWRVYGINMIVRLIERPADLEEVSCPRGHGIFYGEVVAVGDGFEPGANAFREMPPPGSVVCFEEFDEDVEGYYFYVEGSEYRVLSLDNVIISFPPQ
jgi:hypothetical protein